MGTGKQSHFLCLFSPTRQSFEKKGPQAKREWAYVWHHYFHIYSQRVLGADKYVSLETQFENVTELSEVESSDLSELK